MKPLLKISNFNSSSTTIKLLLHNKFYLPDALILMMGDLDGDASVDRFMKPIAPFCVSESFFSCVFGYSHPDLIPQSLICSW